MTLPLPCDDEIQTLPSDGGDHYNRLIFEDSLYLKQHAHQSIHWYPWGQAAFDLAKITNKPLFLSIGYSSCHWCHVMSERTFDRSDVAKKLNNHFVSIKIDRDQRPDLDQLYMTATQLLTQHGGWPNSVFCLPTGQPFYAGTYFPPDDHANGPGFLSLLDQLVGAWTHDQDTILQQAKELERVIYQMNQLQHEPHQSLQLKASYSTMLTTLESRMDTVHGGLMGAPKFPPYASLRLLMSENALDSVHLTLEKMALSGLYDQVEGGFHRYSTDDTWHLPHFEKMLMDNAQMIELYAAMHRQSPRALYQRIVFETIDHLIAQWQLPTGGFMSTMDAQSDGEEGQYYTISHDELRALAPNALVKQWEDHFQLSEDGNLTDEATGNKTGTNVFHPISNDPGFDLTEFRKVLTSFRHHHRQFPQKDEAFLIAPNAWLAKALYVAASVFSQPAWESLANHTMQIVRQAIDDQLDEVYLDDVVYALSAALCKKDNLNECEIYWGILMDRFYDEIQGGAWFSQSTHRTPISRIKDIYDRAEPSPNGVLIECAFQLYQQTKNAHYYKQALHATDAFMSTVLSSQFGCETYWLGVSSYWRLMPSGNGCRVLRSRCLLVGDCTVAVELDLLIDDGHYLMDDASINIVGSTKWLSRSVDPVKCRRMTWTQEIVACASGSVRFNGRVRLEHESDHVWVSLPICSDRACFDPLMVQIPVIHP